MFIATLDSESFSWLAAGRTEKEARAAMRAGFITHLRTYGYEADLLDDEEAQARWEEYADGVNVTELQPGQCARDYSVIHPEED